MPPVPSRGGAAALGRPLVGALFVSSALLSLVSWYTTQQGMAGGPHPGGEGKVPSLRGLVERKKYKDAADLVLALQNGEELGYEDLSSGGMISLCGCWGCTLSFLDVDERLLALLDKITILRCSLTDIKRIPERCAIGFIEGGVANEENIETLQHFRENCDILISVGACAIWGGVPAMRNMQAIGMSRAVYCCRWRCSS